MITQNQTKKRRIHRKAGQTTMTGRTMCLTLTMAITAFTQTANADEAKRNIWRGWNTFEPDPEALGFASISTRDNSGNAPDGSRTDRIASYLVPFANAGTYDLHVRLQNGGTMFFSKVFSDVYEWQEARSPKPADGGYSWINLSETYKSKQKDLTYTVDAPGAKVLGIASRNRGHRIDAFAFGLADKTFTDAQLSAAAMGKPESGLIAFQAESALSFGEDKLTENGYRLMTKYEQMLVASSEEIGKHLPEIESGQQKALQDLMAALKLQLIEYELYKLSWRRSYEHKVTSVSNAQRRVGLTPAWMAAAELALENALAMDDDHEDKARAIETAEKRLESLKKNEGKWKNDLAKAEEQIVTARENKAKYDAELQVGTDATAQAKAALAQTVDALDIDKLLASDVLDEALAINAVIASASPFKLAKYAQQGAEQEQRINQLLGDKELMLQMLVADGPTGNQFGPALEIYQAIQQASPRAKEGIFHRLAMAVALEHAEPIQLSVSPAEGDEPQFADPVQRYLSYEKAYLDGLLDPGFAGLDTWSLRMVVNGDEPDEISAWGREMLSNFRPDHMTRDYDRRYSQIVGTDVPYGSEFVKLGWDRDDLNFFQNILANAGICGRRAFFGRFILRAFGIPTTARSEPGHAALVRWTPDGWVPYLGGPWGTGNRTIFHHYPTDLDFLASTQARVEPERFMKVKRAQWIGNARGEGIQYGYHDNVRRRDWAKYAKQSLDEIDVPGFWNIVSSVTQNAIVKGLNAQTRDAVDADLGESTEPQLDDSLAQLDIPAAEREVTVDGNGIIHVPAAAATKPTNNTDAIRFMPSNRGGIQVHFGQQAGADILEYTIDAPKAGKYHLTANLVTPAPKQHLFLKVNDATDRIDFQLPYTIGMWGEIEPVEIELSQGKNTLSFHRSHYFQRGVTIRDFTLTPVK